MSKNKIIYVPMGADILHSGHLNIINKAKINEVDARIFNILKLSKPKLL